METIFIVLEVQKLTGLRLASGGEASPCYLAPVPRRRPGGQAGTVLQFSDYHSAPEAPAPEAPGPAPVAPVEGRGPRAPVAKARVAGMVLDFCASAAILAMAVMVVLQF